ncbi:hypothetical protein [Pseudooceanicola atlanticus]|uniref:hypothetical protein n=1 Tax=Pseudooceanicola atlanticus TaxID=1461694 RepID=UPI002352E11A|nr:hypothetical protein [Pseudooceanicola atlanticus]
MQPGEIKYLGNYFIQCDEVIDPSGKSHVIWRVGEVLAGQKRYDADAGIKSFDAAVDWVARQQS